MQQQEGESDDKKKVLEMLQRVEEPEEEDEFDFDDLDSDDESGDNGDIAERLAEVDLNNADAVWERLTDEEKQEFKSIVFNGEIEKIVEPVEPWWKQKLEEKLVRDFKEDEIRVKTILSKCPKLIAEIKDFQKISTKTPAPCIIYNIANLVGSYSYIFRYYNGDLMSYELEATDNLISICDNLKANANFESIISVADSIMMNCLNLNLCSDLSTKTLILEDLKDIIDGPGDEKHASAFILAALSETIGLFQCAKLKYRQDIPKQTSSNSAGTKKKFSSEFMSSDGRSECKQLENQTHFTGCLRKLEFYLSFMKFRYNCVEWPLSWEIV